MVVVAAIGTIVAHAGNQQDSKKVETAGPIFLLGMDDACRRNLEVRHESLEIRIIAHPLQI